MKLLRCICVCQVLKGILVRLKLHSSMVVVAHAFSPRTQEAEGDRLPSLRPVWSTYFVLGQTRPQQRNTVLK